MRGISKKILISLLTTLVVFITVFATTYAWVGIFTYAKSDSFKMNLKVQDLDSNYFLTISSSGNPGTFQWERPIPSIELERQIVNNIYNNEFITDSDESIHSTFERVKLAPVTTLLNEDNTFTNFEEIDYTYSSLRLVESLDYYKFDLYLSVDTKEGITPSTTGIKANILLANIQDTLTGTISGGQFNNSNPFMNLPSSPINDFLKSIPNNYYVNSKNACRIGLSIYNPINIYDEYSEDDKPYKTYIFQGGLTNPNYNQEEKYYDLGGCLPYEQNTALQELSVIRPGYSSLPEGLMDEKLLLATNRNDLELSEDNARIWNKYEHSDNYLGCMNGVQTKMKITIYFWFEGWDADCLQLIEKKPVSINLAFTSGTDD